MVNTKKVKQIYQTGYAKMASHFNEPRLNEVKKLLSVCVQSSPKRFLDVGCGDGLFTKKLGEDIGVKEMYGIDIAVKAVTTAQSLGIQASCLDVDEKDFPFSDNYFDFIYCGNLIELVADADHLLQEANRVLKEKGLFIITFPNMAAWLSRLALFLGFYPYYYRVSTNYDLGKFFSSLKKGASTGFIRLFTLSSFKQLAKIYGFHIKKIIGVQEKTLPKPLQLVDFLMCRIPSLAFQIVCVLEKA